MAKNTKKMVGTKNKKNTQPKIKIIDVQNKKSAIKDIIKTAEELQEKCSKYGINAFQPGAIKELKTALILGHNWISTKAQADACSVDNKCFYEYLSATEKGNGQIDRFFKDGPKNTEQHEKYEQSMKRITRNKCFYLAYTNSNPSKPLDILRIYKVPTAEIKKEAIRQLSNSKNSISHIGFDEAFAKKHGELVYQKKSIK